MYFDRMQDVHLNKDVGSVPYYIAKKNNLDLEYFTGDECKKTNFRGFNIRKINRFPSFKINLFFYYFLLTNRNKVDLLITLHCRWYNLILGYFFKFLNPKGKYYIKADQNLDRNEDLRNLANYKVTFKKFDLKLLIKREVNSFFYKFLIHVDYLSFEQNCTYNHVFRYGIFNNNVSNKIFKLANGFDDYNVATEVFLTQKENLIITTGRIGAPGKNHKFLLDIIKEINLLNWKMLFIGPIDDDFKKDINFFFQNNSNFINKVIFIGNILDRDELYSFYKKSKIFLFSSNKESYPLVFSEARFFGNYIVSTNVGGANEITENGKFGIVFDQYNKNSFVDHINFLLSGKDNFLDEKIELILANKEQLIWSNLLHDFNYNFC